MTLTNSMTILPNEQSLVDQPQTLVNVQKARMAERRAFSGNVGEILTELLQNSQRAGAERVDIECDCDEGTMVIRDDGHGIEGGVEGFAKLLWMYESNYAAEVEANQKPMGIGIYSLFAHEQMKSVTLRSGGLEIEIDDIDRWWRDPDYYSQWQTWMKPSPVKVGLEIEMKCSPELVQSVETMLNRDVRKADQISLELDSPAWGYEGRLEVHLNRVPVSTGIPIEQGITVLATAIYQGNVLIVVHSDQGEFYNKRKGIVNWYGQLIYVNLKLGKFGFYLKVGEGAPVNPIKPTRKSLIVDEKLAALRAFIVDEVFKSLQTDSPHATVDIVCALSQLSVSRFKRDCPFFLSIPILPYESGENRDDAGAEMSVQRYTNPPLLIHSEVEVEGGEGAGYEEAALETFRRGCGAEFHRLQIGDDSRLVQHTLYWKPGKPHEEANTRIGAAYFYERGEWGLGSATEPPATWNAVTGDVLMYDASSGYYADEIHWLIGCNDPIDCFGSDAWVAFSKDDDDRPDDHEDVYDKSIDMVVRMLMGDAVSPNFNRSHLEYFVKEQTKKDGVKVKSVEWKDKEPEKCQVIVIRGQSTEGSFEVEAKLYG